MRAIIKGKRPGSPGVFDVDAIEIQRRPVGLALAETFTVAVWLLTLPHGFVTRTQYDVVSFSAEVVKFADVPPGSGKFDKSAGAGEPLVRKRSAAGCLHGKLRRPAGTDRGALRLIDAEDERRVAEDGDEDRGGGGGDSVGRRDRDDVIAGGRRRRRADGQDFVAGARGFDDRVIDGNEQIVGVALSGDG